MVIADEALSALDVSVQAQTVNLLLELQAELGVAYLFIAHDLSLVSHISDRVAVMYLGRIVELAAAKDIFDAPKHPYTRALMASAPVADPHQRGAARAGLEGEVADPANAPPGCAFHPRCAIASKHCRAEAPMLRAVGGTLVACHNAG